MLKETGELVFQRTDPVSITCVFGPAAKTSDGSAPLTKPCTRPKSTLTFLVCGACVLLIVTTTPLLLTAYRMVTSTSRFAQGRLSRNGSNLFKVSVYGM